MSKLELKLSVPSTVRSLRVTCFGSNIGLVLPINLGMIGGDLPIARVRHEEYAEPFAARINDPTASESGCTVQLDGGFFENENVEQRARRVGAAQ